MSRVQEIDERERALRGELLNALPDRPRYVMARGLLLAGRGEVLLGPEGKRGAGYFVIDTDRPGVCQALFRPVEGLLRELFRRCDRCHEILVERENAEHLASLLPDWVARPTTVHVHPAPESLAVGDEEGDVGYLLPGEPGRLDHLPPRLRRDVTIALEHGPVTASFVEGRPVAFAAAIFRTESWWGMEVATTEEHRRRGHASRAAALLIHDELALGRKPVWNALDANQASLQMAAHYGFRTVDRMVVLTPPERRRVRRDP